jgi:hypothetical protein
MTGSDQPTRPPTSVDGQPGIPAGLNHKLRSGDGVPAAANA